MIDLHTLMPLVTGNGSVPLLLFGGGALVALLGLALHALASRSSAAQRHAILAATALGLLILPLARVAGPELWLEILPPAVERSSVWPAAAKPLRETIAPTPPLPELDVSSSQPIPGTNEASLPSPAAVVLALYLAGVVLTLMPLVAGTLRMIWLVKNARPAEGSLGMPQLPGTRATEGLRILVSDAVRVPLAWGWRRPVLLLPTSSCNWSSGMVRDAIVHELAHLERRDLLFQTITRVAVALHWPNPLSWLVLRRLLLEAEQACDDRVLESGTNTADYAERLLKIAAGAEQAALRRLSAVAMARSSQLATRIESLFEHSRKRAFRLGPIRAAATTALLLVPAMVMGTVRLDARDTTTASDERFDVQSARTLDGSLDDHDWDDDGDADESPLYAAIRKGDVRIVASLLDIGADPNARWSGDGTPLIVAVREGRRDIIDLLLARGARPDEGVEGDGNALIVASDLGDLESLRRFLALDVDIDRGVPGDGNPLIAASGSGSLEAMRLLVEAGADIEAIVPGDENPLIKACEEGQLEAARYLLSLGADVNARVPAQRWRNGREEVVIHTPLSRARGSGNDGIVRLLISVGARE